MPQRITLSAGPNFREYYIDPVKAKAEGRHTGRLKEIDKLFQDSFEQSELGPIPEELPTIVTSDTGLCLQLVDYKRKDFFAIIDPITQDNLALTP